MCNQIAKRCEDGYTHTHTHTPTTLTTASHCIQFHEMIENIECILVRYMCHALTIWNKQGWLFVHFWHHSNSHNNNTFCQSISLLNANVNNDLMSDKVYTVINRKYNLRLNFFSIFLSVWAECFSVIWIRKFRNKERCVSGVSAKERLMWIFSC